VAAGQVEKFRSFWLGNMVMVVATEAALEEIVSRPDVARVSPDYPIVSIQPTSEGGDEPIIAGHEIGLERIHADQVWAMGYTGEGRLVSHLDTGVDGNHPAFSARWAGNRPGYDPAWAWFDPVTNTDFPFDSGSHGTHTMGTMCGLGEATGDTIGVAFGAEWISAGVIDRVSIPQTVADAILAFQWTADPDGDPGTVVDVPDCNSNSWGVGTFHGYESCDPIFWESLDGCEAAGVVVLFAAGNEGSGPRSLRNPATRASTDLESFSVGAVEGDNSDLPIAGFSSRGPSDCTPTGDDTFKPEVAAPGVNVRSSVPGGGYQGGWSGTSMACPHAAGVVALIRQANPSLSTAQVKQIMLDTAFEPPADGDPGEDNNYGMGVVNAYEAVLLALAYLDGWGTLGGNVTDLGTGLPIQGAHISVIGRPWGANSRANGDFYMFMPADTAWQIKVEKPPNYLPVFDTVTVVENDTFFQNYALEGKVQCTFTASFGNPADVAYRSFFYKGSWDSDGFWDAGWSGPLTEIFDDGQAPDQTAGDGIFTGLTLLARDLVHSYGWALYTEDYGGEAANLQNGASFQILNLNPVTVPQLSVNPTGSDHNWDISVYGNGGALAFDLLPGINSHPYEWGSAYWLSAGQTYTFLFRPMHSTNANWGVGGVGGASIVFNCVLSGSYDFEFNDRTDQYQVLLSGTDGPPTYLSARGGLDGHIPVSWLPPGTVESSEMSFDDGALMNGYYYFAYDNLMATMFYVDTDVTIDSVMVHVLTEGDPYHPWPDGSHDPVGISVFLDDGGGFPQTDPVYYTEVTLETPGEWLRVDVEEISVPGGTSFWVAMNNLAGGGEDGMGLDAGTDFPGNKWARESGSWFNQDYYSGDHMIRCKVFGLAAGFWVGYDTPTPAVDRSDVPLAGNAQLTSGSLTPNPTLTAANAGSMNRMAYKPRIAPVHPPMILNTDVLAGYRLYRSSSPNPYSGGVGNLVNDPAIPGGLINVTNYDDWCRFGGGDSIVNGVTYYYEGSAVYQVADSLGDSVYVEFGPSNQDDAMAINAPPAPPTNLTGYSVINDVYLTWNRSLAYDIQGPPGGYHVWRRNYNEDVFNLVGTVLAPETTFHEVVMLEGIHRYKVSAFDDEFAEAGYSNSVDIPIGAIPPRDMQASTDEEFQISLRWQLPGGSGGGGGDVLVIAADEASMFIGELSGFDDINSVTYWDARTGTPTLADLEPYFGCVVWSNYVFQDPVGMGDVLADYADAGGAVVLAQFCFASGWGLQGRIMDEYSPFNTAPTQYFQTCLGEFDAGHCIMEGVTDVCDIYWATVSLINGGELVASWSDGTPFVAVNPDVPVAAVNGFVGDPRQFTGDMALVMHNALVCGGGATVIPDSFHVYKASDIGGPYSFIRSQPGTDPPRYVDAPVPNGVPYWYYATAVYPGPDESDPTNIAMGIALNYPPDPPFGFTCLVDDRNVYINWSFVDDMGDWDHFNVYKKLVPGGTDTFVGSTTNMSDTVTIPEGEDGVYAIFVRAVDNGAPQLESANSNQCFAPIGNLPPNSLSATSGLEFHIPLRWGEPGMRPTTTLSYDDGTLENAYYYFAYDNLAANMFTVAGGVEIETLWVHVLTEGDNFWPWPDGSHDPVGISVFDDDGSGMPQFDPAFYTEVTCELGQWISIPIEGGLALTGPNFWVAWNNLAGGNEDGIGLDAATDYPGFKWAREGGTWFNQDYYSGDHMIRATVIDNGRTLTIGYDSAIPATASIRQKTVPEPGLVTATEGARPGIPADPSVLSSGGGDLPWIMDTELLIGYEVYKNLSSPVPVDPAHRLRTWQQQGLERTYNDSDVTHGVTYFYVTRAVYYNAPDTEYSPLSNEASGMATNHPPANPVNLTGYAALDIVYLDWDPNTELDIGSYDIHRKNYGEQNWNFVANVLHPTTNWQGPCNTDGIHSYKIAAKDTEDVVSVGFSNSVNVVCGAIPPRDMVASTTQESQITVGWRAPGGTGGGGDMLLLAADDYPTQLIDELLLYEDITSVTYWDGRSSTPTLDDLTPYAGIVVWSNYTFQDPYTTGDVLADYADGGGAVVLMQFALAEGWGLFGRIMDEYTPLSPAFVSYFQSCLGDYDPGHCIMEGVTDVCDVYRSPCTVINNGVLVASWQDGYPFVAANPDVPVFGINGYPGPYRQFTGDMPLVIHNALVCSGGSAPEPLSYNIYRAPVIGGPFSLVRNQPATDPRTWVDAPVPNDEDFYYYATSVYPGPDESGPTNIAMGIARLGADINVIPDAFNRSIAPGVIDSSDMFVVNGGGLDLHYSIVTQVDVALGERPDPYPRHWQFATERMELNDIPHPKSAGDNHPSNPPQILGRGGPDAWGYQWIDSDEPGGPLFQWADIVGRGVQLFMGDDENQGDYDIGFTFPFYGNFFNTMRICSNGWISPTNFGINYWHGCFPDFGGPENLIAPFQDDMNFNDGGEFWYYSTPDSFVVSWIDVPHYGGGGPYTYQVVLTPDGRMSFNYLTMYDPTYNALIGIQNGDFSIALEVVCSADYVHDGLTVDITTGWLSCSPLSGDVPGNNGSDTVDVIFDATSLDEGVYTGSITVSGSDVNGPVGQEVVPVTLTVTTTPTCDYVVGDINDNNAFNGVDVTYGVRYFKGGDPPPYSCDCPPNGIWFVAGDVNGNCAFNGIDITYMVAYFKGGPLPIPCPDCPPGLLVAPGEDGTPAVMPALKSNAIIGGGSLER
jgi:subtilisin family serine protease